MYVNFRLFKVSVQTSNSSKLFAIVVLTFKKIFHLIFKMYLLEHNIKKKLNDEKVFNVLTTWKR